MFISLMSKGVYNILTAIQRRSLSAGVAQQMKICKVQWKAVIKEKQKEDWVLALYWVRIRHCFLSGYEGYGVQLKTNGKRLFVRSIVSVIKPGDQEIAKSMRNCISFVVRNGKNVSLWNDNGQEIQSSSFLFRDYSCLHAHQQQQYQIWKLG